MLARQFLYAATMLVILHTSQALAADVVTLRCDYPRYYEKIVADRKGISVTLYAKKIDTGKLVHSNSYTRNKKDDETESYYRINRTEITFGTKFNSPGVAIQSDSTIDLRSGIKTDHLKFIGGESTQRPDKVGKCKPN